MKGKKQDKYLREMFRNKLENAEVNPGPSVSAAIMKKLAVKEFLRFNPFRFNVYYLGGLAAATLTATLLISHGKHGSAVLPPSGEIYSKPLIDSVEIYKPTVDIKQKIDIPVKRASVSKPAPAMKAKQNPQGPEKLSLPVKDSAAKIDFASGRIDEQLKNKELFVTRSEEQLRLQDSNPGREQIPESSVTEGCAPLRVHFTSSLSGNDSCLWSFGDGGSSAARNPDWIYDVEGEYRVTLEIFGRDGKTSSGSTVISVYPRPVARFEINPDKVIIPDDEVHFANFSASAVRYLWSFGDGETSDMFEPVHRYYKYGSYDVTLKVFSDHGCSDSLAVINAFSRSAYFIQFPNAFIPNPGGPSGGLYSQQSDESAQVFHPSYSGVAEYNLKIFSKMGILIFESNDITLGWDGYFKGQLSNAGVYIWKVRGNFSNGEPFTRMGDVTLLKN